MRATNRRMGALAAACCLGLISSAKADDLSLQPDYSTPNRPLYLQTEPAAATPETPPPAPPKALAAALEKMGINTGPFQIYGFAEGSYTYGMSGPPNNLLSGRVFDIDSQEVLLNQL